MPRFHFLSTPSNFRELLPRPDRREPLRRLRCCPQGGQCLCCTDGTENLSTRVFHHARGLTVACLCDHSSRTRCQSGAGDGSCGGGIWLQPACACRGGTCWKGILSPPWCRRNDWCLPAHPRSLCKACASGFLEAPAQERSGWPRYRSEEHEKHKAAYLLRHEARETSGHPYQRRRLLLRRPASVSVYLRLSPEVNGAMASRLHFVHFTFEN